MIIFKNSIWKHIPFTAVNYFNGTLKNNYTSPAIE